MLMWGGFGRRGNRDGDFIIDAVLMSKEAGRPVKVMWTREDDFANGRFRPISAHALKAGFDPSGKLTAWSHRIAVDRVGAYMDPVRYQAAGGKDFIAMLGADLRGYDVPHQLVEQFYRDTGVRTNPLRGISFIANRFATELFVDEIARKQGKDPLAYHLDLLKGAPRAIKVVERVAQMAEWGKKRDGRALGRMKKFALILASLAGIGFAAPGYAMEGSAAQERIRLAQANVSVSVGERPAVRHDRGNHYGWAQRSRSSLWRAQPLRSRRQSSDSQEAQAREENGDHRALIA